MCVCKTFTDQNFHLLHPVQHGLFILVENLSELF